MLAISLPGVQAADDTEASGTLEDCLQDLVMRNVGGRARAISRGSGRVTGGRTTCSSLSIAGMLGLAEVRLDGKSPAAAGRRALGLLGCSVSGQLTSDCAVGEGGVVDVDVVVLRVPDDGLEQVLIQIGEAGLPDRCRVDWLGE